MENGEAKGYVKNLYFGKTLITSGLKENPTMSVWGGALIERNESDIHLRFVAHIYDQRSGWDVL